MMKVLQVKKLPVYDVFLGEGWRNWTRVQVLPGSITVTAGAPLSMAQLSDVYNVVKPKEIKK